MTSPPRERLRALVATAVAVAASLLVLAAYLVKAGALVAYPWDWSPDEGLYLDWGRRAAQDFHALHGKSWVPFPSTYGPGLPLLLAPLAPLGPLMLPAARMLAIAWTAIGAFAVYRLVRPSAGPSAALAAAALSLAAFDYSFWPMLIRPDGPMLTLWLLAAVWLLPARLAPGADELSWRRIGVGSALLLGASLTKPTAVVHGAPLVLGWLAVDKRSAARLTATLVVAGGIAVLLLQWATAGGFLWVTQAWSLHGTQAGLREVVLRHAVASLWPLAALAAAALALAHGRRRELGRDASLLLVVGAALIVPFLEKYGASWNYMVPFLPALSVLAARWWAQAWPQPERPGARAIAVAATAALALALAATREFPLPTPLDERTARAFYAFVREHTLKTGGPILATRPEFAYFLVGQPVEMEGSGFERLARHRAPGTEQVLQRLLNREYTLLVALHELPAGAWAEARERGYVHAGGCNLSFYFGTTPVHLFTRRDLPLTLSPPPGTRCGGSSLAGPPARR